MKDFYLKFKDRSTAITELIEAGFTVGEDGYIHHEQCAVDMLGAITNAVGGTDGEPIHEIDACYHVNVRTWGDITFHDDYLVYPRSPVRVWA